MHKVVLFAGNEVDFSKDLLNLLHFHPAKYNHCVYSIEHRIRTGWPVDLRRRDLRDLENV